MRLMGKGNIHFAAIKHSISGTNIARAQDVVFERIQQAIPVELELDHLLGGACKIPYWDTRGMMFRIIFGVAPWSVSEKKALEQGFVDLEEIMIRTGFENVIVKAEWKSGDKTVQACQVKFGVQKFEYNEDYSIMDFATFCSFYRRFGTIIKT